MNKFKLSNPVHFLALGFGSGLLKPAPGTWGTLSAVPLYLITMHFMAADSVAYLLLIFSSFLLGIYLCGRTAEDAGVHDHGAIVWDEIVGFFITMIAIPANWLTLVLGFVLFRVFDIIKPWPISWLDKKVHGGLGIMLDDVLAGVFACLVLHLVMHYWL